MTIFQHTWRQVCDDVKTQTRRTVKPGETAEPDPEASGRYLAVYTAKNRVKWRVGGQYSVQPARTAKAIARFEITRIRRESALDISDDDARAEGFKDRDEFLETWRHINGDKGDCWALDFKLIAPCVTENEG